MQTLTDEQKAPLDYLKENNSKHIVLVDAKAGTGKSHTSRNAVTYLNPKTTLYTAFNKAIVQEGKELFESNVECRTLHSLALSKVRPKLPIEDFTYTCIKEDLSYYDKGLLIKAVDTFYRSASLDAEEYLSNYFKTIVKNFTFLTDVKQDEYVNRMVNLSVAYIDKMIHDEINPTFNYLLKWFHFMLDNGDIDVKYDLVIFDEIQDSTAVALEIFKLIKAKWKLGLGDQNQAIYQFMNLVNGFEILSNTKTFPLTQTFRCSKEIATLVENFGKKYLNDGFHFVGIEHPMKDGKELYISATNASIIETIEQLHREGKNYTLTRNLKEIFAAPLAVLTASKGKTVLHKKYKFLEKEYKNFRKSKYDSFFKYLSEEVVEEEIQATVKLLLQFASKQLNLYDVMNEAKRVKPTPTRIVGTAHSLKGLGAETVYINDDLNSAVTKVLTEGTYTEEDKTVLRLYYVACTRARCNLYNAEHLGNLNITLEESD